MFFRENSDDGSKCAFTDTNSTSFISDKIAVLTGILVAPILQCLGLSNLARG